MGRIIQCRLIAVAFALSISYSATPGFALDPVPPTSVRVGVQVPAGVLLFDGQDYTITPTDRDWVTKIRAAGWYGGKAMNALGVYPPVTASNGNGFFYTVTSTPGINRAIPGNGRALAVEAWDATLGGQTDMYLQYGSGSDRVGHVPGDVWFQYWILAETDPRWQVTFTHPKFIYPVKDNYPCTSFAGCDWVLQNGDYSYNPNALEAHGNMYYSLIGAPANPFSLTGCSTDGTPYPGQVVTNGFFTPGTWYLVRQHFNTSQAAVAAGRHLWETYARRYGESGFTLLSRWQNGQDLAPGGRGCRFTWTIDGSLGYGHKVFRIPTTMGPTSGAGPNSRYYIKDFAMAAGADSGGNGIADLPGYVGY